MINKTDKKNSLLDLIKFISTILIIVAHSLIEFNKKYNIIQTYYLNWFFRFCVPLFFVSSGFYFQIMTKEKQKIYIKRIFLLYIVSTILYLPIIFDVCYPNIDNIIREILFGYYHLWYLSSLLIVLSISYLLEKILSFSCNKKIYIILVVILLFLGVIFDEYYRVLKIPFLNQIVRNLKYIDFSRNFIFMGFPLLTIGRFIAFFKEKIFSIKGRWYILTLVIISILSLLEIAFLDYKCKTINCDLTILNWVPGVFIFIISFYYKSFFFHKNSTILRKIADIMYVIHIFFVYILKKQINIPSFYKCLIVIFFSLIVSLIITLIKNKLKKNKV